ncbi:MAG: M16 family metallopeptidase [Thermodesulfobacteriota bacterium]
MKRRLFIIFLFFNLFILSFADFLFSEEKPYRFTLENGMRIILQENRNAPVVSLQVWVDVGSADEKDEEAGMCHFIEHMIFKGTEKRKVGEIAREIESLGGYINAYTSYDQTVFYITVASRYAFSALEILSDAIQHSTFDSQELEREREVILEEIRMGEDDPDRKLFKETMRTLFKEHPYRRPIIGYEKTIRSITRHQMISFFKRWYTPNRILFVGVGDFDLQEMEKRVREVFQGFKPHGGDIPLRVQEPQFNEVRVNLSTGNFKETYLHLVFPGTSILHEDTPSLDALSHILGRGEASRLVQKVKLEKGLVHSISASSYTPKEPGGFFVEALLPPENIEKALEAILAEIDLLAREGVSSEELYRVKVNIESGLIYDRQTVQGQARKIGFYEIIAGGFEFEKEYLRRVGLLQSEDLKRVAKKYLNPSRMVICLLGPHEKETYFKNLRLREVSERIASSWGQERKEKATQKVHRYILDNGLRILVKENHQLPIVSLQASFLGGVRFEKEESSGIYQLMAMIITKGTSRHNSLEIAKKVEKMAGNLSGFSGYNSFGLTFTFLSHHFEEAFSLFAEILKDPSFDIEELEKRKRLLLASIRQQEDYPDRIVFKLFRKTLYENHPYGMDPLGTEETVQKMTPKDLKEYYQRIMVPENLVLTFVGDVNINKVLTSVKKEFSYLPKKEFTLPQISIQSPPEEIKKKEIFRKKEQAHFVLGFPGLTFKDKDRYALEVLGAALSGQGGRLFYELRDKESLAYALAFLAHPNLDPGYIAVYMGTHPDKLDRAIEGVIRELKKVKEEGLTDDEIERAKRYLIGNFEINLQTNSSQANLISLDELYGIGFNHYERYVQEIQKVKKEEVDHVAKEYFRLEAYVIAILRPPEKKNP